MIAIEAGHNLASIFRLVSQPDNTQDAAQAFNLDFGILRLAKGHHVFNSSADLKVAIRRKTDAS